MAWGKAGSDTLTSANDVLSSGTTPTNKFNQFLIHTISSGNTKLWITMNNDATSKYAYRYDFNGGAAANTDVNYSGFLGFWNEPVTYDRFVVGNFCFISGEEKLGVYHFVETGGSGASAVPERMRVAGKYVPSDLDDTITSVVATNSGNNAGGSYDTDSNVSVLGSDMTPATAVPFPSDVPNYSRFEETDTRKIYTKLTDGNWYELGNLNPWSSTRGVFAGGSSYNLIQYITIDTTGNATDFGDLVHGTREKSTSCSSEVRGVVAGGRIGSSNVDSMEYITIATTGNATDFGDLLDTVTFAAGCSNRTRGCIAGGDNHSSYTDDTIFYITIATTGNASDFGNLTVGRRELGALGNDTRGIFAGGAGNSNIMDYITIATTGNATDFGDLNQGREFPRGVNSDTRGVFGGNGTTIQYITIATTGNATDFGDLTSSRSKFGSVTSNTRGVFGGGGSNVMDYITIDTTGNATDFGDLLQSDDSQTGMDGS